MTNEATTAPRLHLPNNADCVPTSWVWSRLDNVCNGVFDCPHSTPQLTETGPFVVRTQDILTGVFRREQSARVSEATYTERIRRATPVSGDLLYSREGTYFGFAAEVPDHTKVCLGQRMVLIRPDSSRINHRFLRFWLNSPTMASHIHGYRDGTVAERLNLPTIRGLPIPLPPLAEQRAIARVLGALDDKIELNRRLNRSLEELAQAVFRRWFVDFDPVTAKASGRPPVGLDPATAALFPDHFQDSELGEIPKGWMQTKVGEETSLLMGFAFQSKFFTETPPGVRLARGDNVKEGEFYWDNKARYWPAVTSDLERYRLQRGDVLIGMDGSKVGKNWVRVRESDLPCLLVQRVARLRANDSIGQHFITLLIGNPRFRDHVDGVKTGTSIPHISGGQIQKYSFVRPPRNDNRLFARFEEIVDPWIRQTDQNHDESRSLAAARDAMLPPLLSGELRVKDAEKFLEKSL